MVELKLSLQMVQVVPVTRELRGAGAEMQALLALYSFTAFDLALEHY